MSTQPSIDDPNVYVYYRYAPSLAGAAIFTVLFFISTFLHTWQAFSKRAWFLTPFIIGGFFESIGYVGRILSSKDQWLLSPYIMQTLLLLLAPALFAASIYMILGRIILLTDGERYSLIRRTWLTKLFVAGDLLSFGIQGAGGGIMSGGDSSKLRTGENMIIVGLFVQIAVFGFFVIIALLFQRRGCEHLRAISPTVPWKKHMFALYGTSTLILIRSIFRVIEYLQGNAGYLLRHEVFLYVFDALLMFAVVVIMNAIHPGDIAPLLKGMENSKRPTELRERMTSSDENIV